MTLDRRTLIKAKTDPVVFAEAVLRDPETAQPFQLYREERGFLRRAFTLTPEGRLPFPEILFGEPKKSGKTTLAAIAAVYAAVAIGGRLSEVYCLANDLEQAQGRVFQQAARIVEASPLFAGSAKITTNRIGFTSTGAIITALPADYAGAAGANPTLSIFDELWAYTSERSHRLWDEMVPLPTRRAAARLTVTYAGFEGESALLESLFSRGLGGKQVAADTYLADHLLMYWTHDLHAPWQTEAWREQMRATTRPSAFTRQIENRFTSGTEAFVSVAEWDACVNPNLHPVAADPALPVWVGVDAGAKRDCTALVAVTWEPAAKAVVLVGHRVFTPRLGRTLDLSTIVPDALADLAARFAVQTVSYDPMHLVAIAPQLRRSGFPMVEYAQSVPNLTEAGSNLYDLIKDRNLITYPDDGLRKAVGQTVAVETTRGWRLAKEKTSHKIDVVVALSFAALACVRGARGTGPRTRFYGAHGLGVAKGSDGEALSAERRPGVPMPAYESRDWRINPLLVPPR